MKFNAVFKKVPEGYIGFVEELPGANTQGKLMNYHEPRLFQFTFNLTGIVWQAQCFSFGSNR